MGLFGANFIYQTQASLPDQLVNKLPDHVTFIDPWGVIVITGKQQYFTLGSFL